MTSPRGKDQEFYNPGATLKPNPDVVNDFHRYSDYDGAPESQHHTLGLDDNQASPGSHTHDGRNSKQISSLSHTHPVTVAESSNNTETTVTTAGIVRTSIITVLPAGQYLIYMRYFQKTYIDGSAELRASSGAAATAVIDSVGTHNTTGTMTAQYRNLVKQFTHTGGSLNVEARFISEVGSYVIGYAGDSRWATVLRVVRIGD